MGTDDRRAVGTEKGLRVRQEGGGRHVRTLRQKECGTFLQGAGGAAALREGGLGPRGPAK